MTRLHRSQLRLALRIAVWGLLVAGLLGPHQRWSVCLTGACAAHAVATCCSGCGHDEEEAAGQGDGENGASPCGGCCVDLAIAIDEAPLPSPVEAPPPVHAVVAVLPQLQPASGAARAAFLFGHDARPPPPDRRTALVAVTVLRE